MTAKNRGTLVSLHNLFFSSAYFYSCTVHSWFYCADLCVCVCVSLSNFCRKRTMNWISLVYSNTHYQYCYDYTVIFTYFWWCHYTAWGTEGVCVCTCVCVYICVCACRTGSAVVCVKGTQTGNGHIWLWFIVLASSHSNFITHTHTVRISFNRNAF